MSQHKPREFRWSDERSIPDGISQLEYDEETPVELRHEIAKAEEELEQMGAVSYPTISRIQYLLHSFAKD